MYEFRLDFGLDLARARLVPGPIRTSGTHALTAIDRRDHVPVGAETDAERSDAPALWAALSADRRARDERTARLRAMRLIAGEDEGEAA